MKHTIMLRHHRECTYVCACATCCHQASPIFKSASCLHQVSPMGFGTWAWGNQFLWGAPTGCSQDVHIMIMCYHITNMCTALSN